MISKPNTLIKRLEIEQLNLIMYGRQSLYPRQFNGETIDNDIILELLQYANSAPNHKRTRPWRFVVYSGNSKEALLNFKKEFYLKNTPKEHIKANKVEAFEVKKNQISHIIALNMHRDEEKRVPEIEEIAAVSCAAQNIYLALKTYGLGGYWSTGKVSFSDEMKTYLGLSGEDRCLGFFYLGKTDVVIPIPSRENVEPLITWK